MKKILAILLCIGQPSWGAFTYLREASCSGENGCSTAATSTSGATLAVVQVSYLYNNYESPTLIYDTCNEGETYHDAVHGSVNSSNYYGCQIDYILNPAVCGNTQWFWNTSIDDYAVMTVMLFSGSTDATTPVDQTATNYGTGASIQAGSVSPAYNNELLISGVQINGANASMAVDSGFTIANTQAYSIGANVGQGAAYLIQTTAGAVNPKWSWTASQQTGACNATFELTPAAVTSTGGTLPLMGI